MKKLNTRMVVIMGMLIAIQIVLSRFCSINAWNVKIGFGFVPIAIAAILYGPIPAALVGILSDFLGAVLFPIGPYFPGFTLTAGLTGLVYGFLLHKEQSFVRILASALITQFILGLLLNTFWISVLYGSEFGPLMLTRLVQCAILTPVEFIVIQAISKSISLFEKRALA